MDWSHLWHDTSHDCGGQVRSGQACKPIGEPIFQAQAQRTKYLLCVVQILPCPFKLKVMQTHAVRNTKLLQIQMFGRMENNNNAYKSLADTCCKILDAEVVTIEIRLAVVVLLCPKGAAFGQTSWTRLYLVLLYEFFCSPSFCSMDSITFRSAMALRVQKDQLGWPNNIKKLGQPKRHSRA